jgi:hypothetical protein
VLPILSLTKPNSQDLGSILKGGESRVALKLGSVSVGCREDEGWLGRYGPHANRAGEPGKLVGFAYWAKTRGKEEALVNRKGRGLDVLALGQSSWATRRRVGLGNGEAGGLCVQEKKKRVGPDGELGPKNGLGMKIFFLIFKSFLFLGLNQIQLGFKFELSSTRI